MRCAGDTSLFEVAGKLCTVVHAFHPSNILKNGDDKIKDRLPLHKTALLDLCFLRAVNAVQDTQIVGGGIDKLRNMALSNN